MKLVPRTLLARTFLLLAALMLLSVLAWFAIFTTYEREPRARQIAQMIASVVNLTRTSLVSARPDARRELLRELSDREGIHIYPAESDDHIAPLPERAFLQRLQELLQERLGPETRLTLERDGEKALFASFRIDDGDEGEFWIALPIERLDRIFPAQWIGWGIAAVLLSLVGAWLIMFRVTRPLKALEHAAAEIGRGRQPAPLTESGPEELETLARAFNRMSADLARLDDDRALILAGISHDLRTPLTRLRMEIEMTGADEETREAMAADVEEMDRTIGQFLDFARTGSEGGEGLEPIDLAALLRELAEQYRRRGFTVVLEPAFAEDARLPVRVATLRRAIANLIDNALRHAGGEQSVELALARIGGAMRIEVRDRGPGIPAAEADRLKLPFTRLEVARSNAVGAGLGLAIVERIARAHGGSLDLLPREGGGLVARITIPAP
ncbi:ATP-binding protein [Sulfurisoma sediminicola]|uniref:histidine kinase n=1 Tax=Sulfurisoma sediminicola TaxID=1381557 RepID=A0A497XDR5_9PROT|nr:ATP-binding protein [Sulfurisoma sediminicola]RLJ64806.1 two-component system osmolarity sensor histidine kinase EnvZ [Sulfurisoma sediminicola]